MKQDFYAKSLDKKVKKGGGFSGSFSKGPITLAPISGVFWKPYLVTYSGIIWGSIWDQSATIRAEGIFLLFYFNVEVAFGPSFLGVWTTNTHS